MQSNDAIREDVLAEATELARGAEVLPDGVLGLARKLQAARDQGRVLRVKLGFDPTSTNLHLGHTVPLRALARFQEKGHKVVLVVGGFTAQIGDPTGRNVTRPPLSPEQVAANAQTFLDQFSKVVDVGAAEVVNNVDWLGSMLLPAVLKLAAGTTVNQLLGKEAFGDRVAAGQPLALHEVFYPLLQGFDSVAVRADVELGGTDQRFNLLFGRQLQPQFRQEPQAVMMFKLLRGTCGKRKMSKSFGNAIGLADSPDDMFGKTMRIADELIVEFLELATTLSLAQVEAEKKFLADKGNPRDAKEKLAHQLVRQFHGDAAAHAALAAWRRIHTEGLAPLEMPSHVMAEPTGLVGLLVSLKLAGSNSKARGLIEQNGVRIDGQTVTDVKFVVSVPGEGGSVLNVGKRNFVRLVNG